MTKTVCHCEKCGASSEDGRLIDLYGDLDHEPGELVCDPCVEKEFWEANAGPRVVVPVRPEGYYHAPIGAFD